MSLSKQKIYYSLKSIYVASKDWVIPTKFQHIIRKINLTLSSQLTPQELIILARNAQFCNLYAGQRCFVIGNGPSLSQQDLTPLGNEITIVMNHFHRHPILEQWQPTFYCAADPPDTYTPRDIELIKPVASRIHPQAFFLSLAFKAMVESHNLFPLEKTYFIKTEGSLSDRSLQKHWDLTQPVLGFRTTAHMAIMVALYLGCSPIYLIGFDHDWLAHRSVSPHFYPTTSEDTGSPDDLSNYSYKLMVEGTLKTWEIYEALQAFACKRGVTIYNATAGGFLDVFPRVRFETLF